MGHVEKVKQEFFTDSAKYFSDKRGLSIEIRSAIAAETSLPLSMIKFCGSAYWGKSFVEGRDFKPGVSDLDVALVSEMLFTKAMSQVRAATKNFTDRTTFKSEANFQKFRDYSFKKGMFLLSISPNIQVKIQLGKLEQKISLKYKDHFEKISFIIYDTEESFAVKQIGAVLKFRGEE